MVVDARQHVGQIGLRVEAAQFRAFDQRHRARQGFASGIVARKKPVLPSDPDRAHGAFGWVVVDGHAPILEKEAEGVPAVQGVAECLRQVALARDILEVLLGPGLECLDLRAAVRLPDSVALVGAAAVDLRFDVVKRADPFQRFVAISEPVSFSTSKKARRRCAQQAASRNLASPFPSTR